ncbi:hypothetical protein BDB00DRAFT_874514 [Zychaea mexicana]|uniref:uncharacterized protein n=1 Tax=Zychaea mexicana TaxID=64656 RepID=UPI0022FE6F40|nr:uncharacterized protein BDB00DRAFT_874514 [Zychaea mexicana]KAI9491283.1 hypothetical protein BDB00DRAFT_874514 [Zychaea mexicana]
MTALNECASIDVPDRLSAVTHNGQVSAPHLLRRGTEEFFDMSAHPIKDVELFTAARDFYKIGILVLECSLTERRGVSSTKKFDDGSCLPAKDLKESLRASLSPFGTVIQLGLYRAAAGWFQGYGYAVLQKGEDDESLSALKHRLEFGQIGSTMRDFYATWKDMGSYYRDCPHSNSDNRHRKSAKKSANQASASSRHALKNPTTDSGTESSINIGTLNARHLSKVGEPDKQSFYIKDLTQQSLHILALQDTCLPTIIPDPILHSQLHNYDSIWSPYCGLISFTPYIRFEPFISLRDGRELWAKVVHSNHDFAPFYILNIYAPTPRGERLCIVLGDFNHSYDRVHSSYASAPTEWRAFLGEHIINMMTPDDPRQRYIPTFQSSTASSAIDYVFMSISLSSIRI